MAWYDYPTNYSGTEVNSTSDLFLNYPKFIIGDFFAPAIMIIIFITTFTLSMMSGSKKAMLTSFFISMIFSIYFVKLSLLNMGWMIFFIIGTALAIIFNMGDNSNY